ncbi:TonB-dependent receptor [Marinobacterium ramblicola]|uniref:TonB-dependent receptor n=1 Tax=Marinobacterium ramblicola TaxID=2849041 RepID=UPI001FEAF31E|nr:TonB-dependent receptor [Marinobacterium ramblicola]
MNRDAKFRALLPLILAAPVIAQGAESSEAVTLDTMVIETSRAKTEQDKSPQVVTVITREQIEKQLAISSDSSELLSSLLPAYTPSRQKMTASGETFRGRTPLLMIDGVPQSNPLRATGREGHTIDFSMVERIEVIHGASALHGLGATGGIINIITRRPEQGQVNQHVSVQATLPTSNAGSDTLGYKTDYRVDGTSGNVDYLFGLSHEDQGLFVDGNGDPIGVDNTQGDQMDTRSYDLIAKLGYWLDDDKRVQGSVNHYRIKSNHNYVSVTGDRDAGIPTTSERGTPEGDAPFNKVTTSSLTYEDFDLNGMELSAQLFNQQFESLFGATLTSTFQDASIAPVGTLYDQSRVLASKWGTKINLTKDDLFDDRLKVTGGFDILFDQTEQDLYQTDRTWVPEVNYTNYAPFVQLELQATDALVLQGGVRHEIAKLEVDTYTTLASANGVTVDGGSPEFEETLYNVGAVYNLTPALSLFANYSEGFGMPDVGRVLRGIKTADQDVDTFLDLQPIVTDNIEVGTRFKRDKLDLELSYYRSDSDLGSRLERIDDVYYVRREKTRIDGVEASLGYRVNDLHKVKLAYSYIRGRYDSDDNGTLDAKLNGLNIAPNRLITSWSANWNDRLDTFLQANYAFDRSFDNPNLEFDGYLLVDASAGYKLPHGQLNLSVANLFDKEYITYYSQSALANDNRYFMGRGRTLTLGYSLDF